MLKLFKCRRTSIALIAMACLTALGLIKGVDVASAIAAVAIGLAGANSAENAVRNYRRPDGEVDNGQR